MDLRERSMSFRGTIVPLPVKVEGSRGDTDFFGSSRYLYDSSGFSDIL